LDATARRGSEIVGAVPDIDIVDSTWICIRPSVLAALVAEPSNWRKWWPQLTLSVDEWRGDKGVRWTVAPSEGGSVVGSMEVWLEPQFDGVVAHYFVRLDGARRRLSRRRARRLSHRYRTSCKRLFWSLGDQLDPGRLARVADRRQVASAE
jgi:hypothetical protein